METKRYSGLFSPGGCLTSPTFQRYLDRSLRPAEKVKVEEHLRHCLICSDALEGYKRHRNSTFMKSDLEFLSGKIRKRYASRTAPKRGIPVFIVVTLLVFMLILLIVYYIIRYLLVSP